MSPSDDIPPEVRAPSAPRVPMTMDPAHPERVHTDRIEWRIAALKKDREAYREGTFSWDVKNEGILLLQELLSFRARSDEAAGDRSPEEDASYYASIWQLSTPRMQELERAFRRQRTAGQQVKEKARG